MAEKKRNTNVELNLTDMFWQFLCMWKKVLILAVALGLVFGGVKLVTSLINNNDPEYLQEVKRKNRVTKDSYEVQVLTYEKQINNIQAQIEKIEETRENSIMLRMNPYSVYVKNVSFYIGTDYKIMPEMTYQDPNYAIAITNSYINAVKSLNLDKAVATPEEPDLTAQNPVINVDYSLLTIEDQSGNGMFYLTIKGDSPECVDRIFTAVQER